MECISPLAKLVILSSMGHPSYSVRKPADCSILHSFLQVELATCSGSHGNAHWAGAVVAVFDSSFVTHTACFAETVLDETRCKDL